MPKAAKRKSDDNSSILEYALSHLEREAAEIQAKIDHVKRQLGRGAASAAPAVASVGASAPAPAAGTGKKRVLSAAARKRIAAAQKRRWAEHRKAKAKAGVKGAAKAA